MDIDPPASGTGDDCVIEVEFSYTLTNTGSGVERIYSLEITRGGETVDITNTFPITGKPMYRTEYPSLGSYLANTRTTELKPRAPLLYMKTRHCTR